MADKQTKVTMVLSPSWRDHFKIDDSLLEAFWEDFSQSSPIRASEMNPATAEQSIEFVLWCVQQGHFTEEAFTKWQSQAFEIPVIRKAFFEAPTDLVFWERVKELHPWSATCMPLAEWDDVLLVAITTANSELALSRRHRLVLATPTALREFFERVDHASVSNPRIQVAPAAAKPEIKPELKPETKPEPIKVAPKVDDGDPFAALSRELDLLNQKGGSDQANTDSIGDDHALPVIDEHSAPEGLVIPEGLSFDPAELSRLNGLNLSHQDNIHSEPQPAAETDEDGSDVSFELPQTDSQSPVQTSQATTQTQTHSASDDENAPEGGTLVHNFETGKDEVVDKHRETNSGVSSTVQPEVVADPAALSLEPIKNVDDDPLAALVMPTGPAATEPKKPGFNAEIPGLPFAGNLTGSDTSSDENFPPSQNETVSQASPFSDKTFGQKPAISANDNSIPGLEDLDKTHPSAVMPNPDPVKTPEPALQVDAPVTARIRKPLFEPASSAPPKTTGNAFEPRSASGPGFDATKAVSIQNNSANANDQTASGVTTGTQTKSRRLDPTPVTSMFGANNPAIHQERPGNGAQAAYLNKSIAVGKLDPIHLDQCRSIDEAGAQAIMQACNIFETAMILLFKDGDLMPWKWNDLFLSVHGDKPVPIDLVEPSIFKVVFRTAKPYHGYVV
ncbi:MAG: hypothetical protein U1E10_05350, partial [Bdellovibrionales bacterium]|nr:hypothetical protein [Bdellovibrionales bacterium]